MRVRIIIIVLFFVIFGVSMVISSSKIEEDYRNEADLECDVIDPEEMKESVVEDLEPKSIEYIEVDQKNISLFEGEKGIIEMSFTPLYVKYWELGITVTENNIVSIDKNINSQGGYLELTGMSSGKTQIVISYGDKQEVVDVCINEKEYTLDTLPDGIFYERQGKIYELEQDDLTSYSQWESIIGWIKSKDYSLENVPIVYKGETIYVKGEEVGQFYTCYYDGTSVFSEKEVDDYWGYIYEDYLLEEELFDFHIQYINNEEIDWKDYCERTWGNWNPSLSEMIININEGDSITVGGFDGTEYLEKTLTADVWVAVTQAVYANFELTKDGYAYYTFPYDCRTGYYCLKQYSNELLDYTYHWIYVVDEKDILE